MFPDDDFSHAVRGLWTFAEHEKNEGEQHICIIRVIYKRICKNSVSLYYHEELA